MESAMDLYQLKIFFTLAKTNHFTRAADLLFITQSAVSHAVKKLETSIGTKLIERKSRQLTLTEAGKALYRSCEKIFYEIEKASQDIALLNKKADFSIFIGCTVEFGNNILINHIKDFIDINPGIHLDFLFSHHLIDHLIQDEVDLIIDCKPHTHKNIQAVYLFREQYVAIASPQFIQKENIVCLDDLERIKILSMDKDLDWWKNFLTAIPDQKKDCLKNVMQINHIRGLINAAISGLGIGFVPKYTVLRELNENILQDPFPKIRPAADNFNIFIKKEKLDFQKIRLLIDYLTRLKPSEFGVD